MSGMRPEFLSLKYRGVRTPWEIEDDPDKFGWQCRKYIRWKAVHENKSDPETLKQFADNLLDKKIFNRKALPIINLIFEKVQRWRKDRVKLSIEPDLRDGYEVLARTLRIASDTPSVVRAVLERAKVWDDHISGEDAIARFTIYLLGEFLATFPGAPQCDYAACNDCGEAERHFVDAVKALYKAYGLTAPHTPAPLAMAKNLLGDLGISYALSPELVAKAAVQAASEEPRIVVEEIEDNETLLLVPRYSRGQLILGVNKKHPWFRAAKLHLDDPDAPARRVCEALGEATLDMLGDLETLQRFFAYLGLNLYRAAPKRT